MVLVGAILLILGVAAVRSEQPAFNYILFGAVLSILGSALWNKLRSKKRRNTRFSLFRKGEQQEDDNQKENDSWGGW